MNDVIDVIPEGKNFYLISTSKTDETLPSWLDEDTDPWFVLGYLSRSRKYFFIVKAKSVQDAHRFAGKHLGRGVSFSSRKTSPEFVSVMTEIDIFDA